MKKNVLIIIYLLPSFSLLSFASNHNSLGNHFETDRMPGVFLQDTNVVSLDEVVVRAFNRTDRILEVPGSLSHIGSLQIDRIKPETDLMPILDYVPGVFAHVGATNTSRVSIRGIGARVPYSTGKIRGYFNNIPLTNTSGDTFLQDIDPSILQSIDVVKGPATSAYGAGLGGTITMQTRQPRLRQTGFRNTSEAGSFDFFKNSLILDLVSGDNATSLSYTHMQSDGYRDNNRFNRDAVTSVSQFNAFNDVDITALLSYTRLKSFIPSSIDSITFVDDPTSAAANWMKTEGYEDSDRFLGGITGSKIFSEKLSGDITLFSVWNQEKEMRPFDVYYQERFTAGTRLKAKYALLQGSFSMDVSAGGEYLFEQYQYSNFENIDGEGVQGERISDNREEVFTGNTFMQVDGQWNRLRYSAGINANFTSINYTDLFHEGPLNKSGLYDYGNIISPRISTNYVYVDDHSLFATISHGFAPPSLSETLTPDGFINPDIRPEKSWNYEAGLRGSFDGGNLFYDVSIYQMNVQDLLVAQRIGGDAWIGRNAGNSRHRGLEAELHWIMIQRTNALLFQLNELSFRSNYTLNDFIFTEFNDFGNDRAGNIIPGIPQQVIHISVYSETGLGLYFMPSLRYVDEMAMNDANTLFSQPYTLLNVMAGYKTTLGNGRWDMDLFFKANNLFDQKYASMILVNAPSFGNSLPRYYYPGLPLHFFMGLKIGFRS
ncbi:MAG: TonB-dependent receptor family protein [Bacteroidales bacterium]